MSETISDLLKLVYTDIKNTGNTAWVTFIKDHRAFLLETSTVMVLSKEVMFTNRYRPDALMRAISVVPALSWIVLYLNNITYNKDLVGKDKLIIPDIKVVKSLYSSFSTYIATTKN